MIKLLRFVRKRRELSLEQFRSRWLDTHLPFQERLLRETPLQSLAVSLSTGQLVGGTEPFFDGMVEMVFADREQARAALASPAAEAMKNDEAALVDASASGAYLFTEEYVQAQGEGWDALAAQPGTAKVVRPVKRKDGLTREQFKHYWLNQHAQLEKTRVVKMLTRRIVATFLTGETLGGAEPDYDGLVSLYYDSVDAAKTHFAGGSQSVMRKDEENFCDLSYEVVRLIAQEYRSR